MLVRCVCFAELWFPISTSNNSLYLLYKTRPFVHYISVSEKRSAWKAAYKGSFIDARLTEGFPVETTEIRGRHCGLYPSQIATDSSRCTLQNPFGFLPSWPCVAGAFGSLDIELSGHRQTHPSMRPSAARPNSTLQRQGKSGQK